MTSEAEVSGPEVAILDYGMGNLRSVHRAFLAVGAAARIVRAPAEVGTARALVFPGQGAIVDTMRLLRELDWVAFLTEWIAADRPFFGICLGLQALFTFSEEGQTPALGIFGGTVRRFPFAPESGIKIPHMGWNQVRFTRPDDPLLEGIDPRADQFYFVHSYYVAPAEPALVWGTTEYGGMEFCSAIRHGRLVATQFHPEKSQQKGLRLYRNFVRSLASAPP